MTVADCSLLETEGSSKGARGRISAERQSLPPHALASRMMRESVKGSVRKQVMISVSQLSGLEPR